MSISYYIGFNFSGAYLSFPLARTNESEAKVSPFVWKTGSVFYFVDCIKNGVFSIRGKNNDKTIFYADINRKLVSNACVGY